MVAPPGSAGRPGHSRPPAEVVEIDAGEAGATLAAVVRERLGLPWSKAKSLCASGRVRVDGATAFDPSARVAEGARVEIAPSGPRRDPRAASPEEIVFVDDDVIVLDKAPSLLTVAYDDEDPRETLVARAVRALKHHGGRKRGRDPRVDVVQRLDKDTSGLLVFARNEPAKRALKDQLRERTVTRRYLAIVHGALGTPAQRIETWIVQDRGDGLRGSWGARPGHRGAPPKHAKRAATHLRVLEPLGPATLVECRLETGRQHQIRIHLAELGHPLVGEPVYLREWVGPAIAAPRCMLHAAELAFDHPRTRERVGFERPPPADFEAVLSRLRSGR